MDFSLTFVCFDFVWNFSPSGTTVASPLYTNAGNVIVSPGCPTNVLSISAKDAKRNFYLIQLASLALILQVICVLNVVVP